MNIYQALKQIEWDKAEYFKYKFPELRYQKERPLKTEEDLLRFTRRKSLNPYYNWELTEEYKNLVVLYLQSKVADDLLKTYEVVSENAKAGDEKSIKLLLQLQKEITSTSKAAIKQLKSNSKQEDDEADSGHDLDLS